MVSPKGEIDNRPKRFYREVTVVGQDDHWSIRLDGKPLRTPEKKLLVLPTEALAKVIADEWRSQTERIDLQNMFNTRLANVVLDRTPASRGELGREAARYAHTDLVCHLAETGKLQDLQEKAWAPLRTWATDKLAVLEPVMRYGKMLMRRHGRLPAKRAISAYRGQRFRHCEKAKGWAKCVSFRSAAWPRCARPACRHCGW